MYKIFKELFGGPPQGRGFVSITSLIPLIAADEIIHDSENIKVAGSVRRKV